MERIGIAKFEKVGYEQFKKDFIKTAEYNMPASKGWLVDTYLKKIYDNIKLPSRVTKGSNGYDFYMPFDLDMVPRDGNSCVPNTYSVPTGIRCYMDEGWGLFLIPRSGLGTKYGFRLINTIGDIDSDYYGAENEGHISATIEVASPLRLEAGQSYMQGVFLPFGIAVDDHADGIRTGGHGSTSSRNN